MPTAHRPVSRRKTAAPSLLGVVSRRNFEKTIYDIFLINLLTLVWQAPRYAQPERLLYPLRLHDRGEEIFRIGRDGVGFTSGRVPTPEFGIGQSVTDLVCA